MDWIAMLKRGRSTVEKLETHQRAAGVRTTTNEQELNQTQAKVKPTQWTPYTLNSPTLGPKLMMFPYFKNWSACESSFSSSIDAIAGDQTNVPKEYFAVGGSVLFGLLVLFGVGAGSLSSVIGFLYPAFQSFKAIENRANSDVTQWLSEYCVWCIRTRTM
eukprot:scaffold10587_cov145-Alexandrium_tamarense.AAC.3